MKKTILLTAALLIFCVNALACELNIYVDSTVKNSMMFNIISSDNKYQFTMKVEPGHSNNLPSIVCTPYNIYAQDLTVNNAIKKSPYGDYVYFDNPLQLTGSLTLYFPKDFKLDSLSH